MTRLSNAVLGQLPQGVVRPRHDRAGDAQC